MNKQETPQAGEGEAAGIDTTEPPAVQPLVLLDRCDIRLVVGQFLRIGDQLRKVGEVRYDEAVMFAADDVPPGDTEEMAWARAMARAAIRAKQKAMES